MLHSSRRTDLNCDILLKGGRVIDPAQGIDGAMDLAVKNGKIISVATDIPQTEAEKVMDVSGKLVIPGLIDLHTHVYQGGTSVGVDADRLCARTGVTTFVDAGSAGAGNFPGFREHVIKYSRARILAFLNLSFPGIFAFTKDVMVGELFDLRLADIPAAVRTANENSDLILGIKARVGLSTSEDLGLAPVYLAIKAAETLGKPVMIHTEDPPPTQSEILSLLRPGDIFTHVFRGSPNSPIDSQGRVLPELWKAKERGVIIDIGHGMGSFTFESARQAIAQGFLPDTISSDIHCLSIDGPAYDLPTTMSKLLNLGVSLAAVIEASTVNPARAIGRDDLGTLREGTVGDITVLELLEGEFEYQDTAGETMVGRQKLASVLTLIKGQPITYSEP